MRLNRKVALALAAGVAWVGISATHLPREPSGASLLADHSNLPVATQTGRSAEAAPGQPRPESATPAQTASPAPGPGSAQAPAQTGGAPAAPMPSASNPTKPAVAAATPVPTAPKAATGTRPHGSVAAGGSSSGSSPTGQVYAQSTQTGYGCQAAIRYLSEHANPEYNLVCPGNAMGHQAMTCYHFDNVCPNSAVIIIADPCPAAYENEAWNSWHMDSGPYDPYGWCNDWSAPKSAPPPPPGAATPTTPPATPGQPRTSDHSWWQPFSYGV